MKRLDELNDTYSHPLPVTNMSSCICMFCHLHHLAGVSDRICPILTKLRKLRSGLRANRQASVAIDRAWEPTQETQAKDSVIDSLGLSAEHYASMPEISSTVAAPDGTDFVCCAGQCHFPSVNFVFLNFPFVTKLTCPFPPPKKLN